ncbi:DNA repair metallo-beta-lactamase-domain-containing protein, partial [Halteromyces radiatus]|uniref:DNA repair metallo-beta-lactamase-domain-containing protein n=1 Tax=Halteromyces radiatus TaxID=101107 RepID=UPI00222018A4
TKFVVDAFSYGKISGCLGYFLTHFHSDHYHGLNEGWCHGPIYCSQITANLVAQQLKVRDIYLHVLPMNEPTFVSSNIKVTLIDANHCPGSVLFIFDIQRKLEEADVDNNIWVRHLHTGDFRANPQMCLHPLLRQPENPPIDHLYLDTTYLNAKYGFPAQEECIQAACKVIEGYMATTNNNQQVTKPSAFDEMMSKAKVQRRIQGLLVVVGSYSIGKEKVFYSIAKLLGSKIFVTSKKWAILMCQENKELANLLTLDQMEAQVHVLPLGDIKAENMHAYLKSLSPRFTNIVAFKPTGWTFQASKAQETDMEIGSLSQVTKAPMDRDLTLTPRHSSPSIKIYGVPYSEHSSFRELASFIASLDIKHVIPTVNNESENARKRMMMYLDKWQNEKQGKTIEIVPYPAVTHW